MPTLLEQRIHPESSFPLAMSQPAHFSGGARSLARPGWLRVGLLLLASGSAALAAAEVVLRITGLAPPTGSLFTVDRETFGRIPGIFEPGLDQVSRENPALPYRASTDSLGYRGSSFPRRPAADELRIFFAGDSNVFGSFVDDGETLPAQTEALLRERCRAPLRVINGGLGGSTIRDQVELIRRGLELEPDLVLLMFSENDIRDLTGPSLWNQLAENREAKSRFPLSWIYPIARHSALWNLALEARSGLQNRRMEVALRGGGGQATGAAVDGPPALARERDTYGRMLVQLRDELAAKHIPLALLVFPSHHTVYGTWESDQFQWAEILGREAGLTTVPLLEPLARDGRDGTELFLLPLDGHASPAGYALAATALAQALVASELTGGRCE